MGQNIDNGLNNVNDIMTDYASTKAGSKSRQYAAYNKYADSNIDVDEVISYKYERGDNRSAVSASVMDNFEEYIKNKNERAREEGVDEEERERQDRENAKELARNLSSEELKQLAFMGIDVSSAKLSDIRGIVNTMRGNAHRERVSQMLSDITAKEISPEDAPAVDIEKISVGTSDEAFVYLVKNNLAMTKDNMYKAYYSGASNGEKSGAAISDEVVEKMQPQIDKIIEQAGYEGDDRALAGAKLLLNNNLPVTTDTITAYMDYQAYADGENNIEGLAIPDNENDIYDIKADELYNKVNSISADTIYDMSLRGKQLTIAAAYKYASEKTVDAEYKYMSRKAAGDTYKYVNDNSDIERDNLKAVSDMRQMEELRLSMTMDAARRLVNRDINIDTRELSKVVEELKNIEKELVNAQLSAEGVEPTDENIAIYNELSEKVAGLGDAPASIIAAPLLGDAFTVNALSDRGELAYNDMPEEVRANNSFEKVVRQYEAVGTAPRADMGDSISKAFSNVDDILKELDMPVSDENRRAVRILGYNSIEITEDNINQVADYDNQVNELIQNFYPEAVISVIRDGINPLDMDISELNQIVRERNYNNGVTEADNFATYLRDMENRGEISPEERESYIGIYRVMSSLAKSGDREAGYLFANGGNLTVRNLISAMRSRKAAGLDVSIDDDFGMLAEREFSGKRIDEQIDLAYITKASDSMTQEVSDFIKENELKYSLVNVQAVSELLSDGGLYDLVSEVLSKMKFKDSTKDDMIDDETENMSKSISGAEIPLEFEADSILESLRNGTDMSLTYEDLRDNLTAFMYQAGAAGTISSMDISSVKIVQAGFNILGGMARRDKYQVPVQTEDGVRVVNLTVKHDERRSGSIELSTSGKLMGKVKMTVKLDGDNNLRGYVISDNSDGNELLSVHADELLAGLKQAGYGTYDISVGVIKDDEEAVQADNRPLARSIYDAAVDIVKSVASILR